MTLFTVGFKIHLRQLNHKWAALNTSVKRPTRCTVIWSLARVVWDAFEHISFCSVNANASWCIPDKDVTGKYVIIVRHGCFGDSAPTLKKMDRNTDVRSWSASETRCIISIWAEDSVQRKQNDLLSFSLSHGLPKLLTSPLLSWFG